MSTINNGVKQRNITDTLVSGLDRNLYENIFNVNIKANNDSFFYFYNILNKIHIPENLTSEVYDVTTMTRDMSWTSLSYKLYGTINLWWVIVLVNKPKYIFKAKSGEEYKFIKQEYVSSILSRIA